MRTRYHNIFDHVAVVAMLVASLAFGLATFSSMPSRAATTQYDSIGDLFSGNAATPPPTTNAYNQQTQAFAGVNGANFGAPRDPRLIVGYIIQIFLTVLGMLFLVYTIYAGWLIMSAQGDEEKISKGKSTLQSGVIGILIILSSYAIVLFVTKIVSAGTVTPKNDQIQKTLDANGVVNVQIKEDPSNFLNSDPFAR